jgi:predicted GNAT family N-acyltransferase
MTPHIRLLAFGSAGHAVAVALRRAVLRAPLGLDFAPGQLAAEAGDAHLGAFDGEALIGAAVLTPYGEGVCKLRQMAVSEAARGTGAGAGLLAAAEAEARRRGARRVVLEARLTARGFYERFGYAAEGGVFTQVTLPHILMAKSI